jgi:hypothetical protein
MKLMLLLFTLFTVQGFWGDMMDDYYTHRRQGVNWMRLKALMGISEKVGPFPGRCKEWPPKINL